MENKNINVGFSFAWGSVLTVVFIILKLTKVIDWKWIWVLSPAWISASISILFAVLFGVIVLALKRKG